MTALAMTIGYVACSEDDGTLTTSTSDVAADVAAPPQTVASVLDEGTERTTAINSVTSTSNVTGGIAGFESEGFTLIDSNSLVMTRTEYVTVPNPALHGDGVDGVAGKDTPGPENVSILESDTIVWLAFENPTHSMSNHAAIVTSWRNNGQKKTVRFQLNVGDGGPAVIEQGIINDGAFEPKDIGLTSFADCLRKDLTLGTVGCLWSNCAWASCMSGVAIVSLLDCAWPYINGE